MNLYLANVNYRFGDNAFLPYSAARLWAYAKAQPGVAERWALREILWQREPVADVIERMRDAPPDCLGLSLYIWSERWSLSLAREVKWEFPQCLIVAGGPQVPERDTTLWAASHRVDCAIRGEGEYLFAQLLKGVPLQPDPAPERASKLDALPSPYLTGVLDDLVARYSEVKWQALQETNRGCPYQCTFCDWGSATYDKVRRFPLDVCVAELEWFAKHRIELLYNCDANFGMLEQDVAFTDALVGQHRRTGYPKKFRAAYAKKINDRVFGVAKRIADAGLSKGATISFQSMDADVLQNVKRLNPVQNSLVQTFKRYADADVPTYTELIVGLPGETYDTFVDGISVLLDAGQHEGLAIYPCMALRNSELSTPENRKRFGLITREVDLLLLHGEPDVESPERYELVIGTDAMPHLDWRRAWEFAIVVQALHCSGISRQVAARYRSSMTYREFYETLIRKAWQLEGPINKALSWWERTLAKAMGCGKWDTVLPQFGKIQWPPEEAFRLIVTHAQNPTFTDDWVTWAREQVWYARKGGVQHKNEENHYVTS